MSRATRPLVALGAAAGPIFILVGLAQMFVREGFDPRRHALSLLSKGSRGWVQIANFMLSGALVFAGANGVRMSRRAQDVGSGTPPFR